MSGAAFFDVDGTLTRSNILLPLIWYQRAHQSRLLFSLWTARLGMSLPRYWWLDRRDRGRVNVLIYRWYAGLAAPSLRLWHQHTFADNFGKRLLRDGHACVREHLDAGRPVILLTGGLDFVMAPLAERLGATEIIATRLIEHQGFLTGEIDGPALAAGHKAERLREYAERHGIDLKESYAYGDSIADGPMLECVGHPVAVNPDRRLRMRAGESGWEVAEWR